MDSLGYLNNFLAEKRFLTACLFHHSEISDKLPETSSLLERAEKGTLERGIER